MEGVESGKAGVGVGRRGVRVAEGLPAAEVLAPPPKRAAAVGVAKAGVLVGVKDRGDVGVGGGDTVLEGVLNPGVEVCV